MQIRYKVVDYCGPYEVDVPHAVYRFISAVGDSNAFIEFPLVTVDDYIEDPEVSDFFVVLARFSDNRWICYYHDRYVICERLTLGYTGTSFLDSGYFYCPYVPSMQTPVVASNTRKGIITKYAKKLLGAKP